MSKLIELTKGAYAIVDNEDYERLNQWKWSLSHRYAVRDRRKDEGPKGKIYMHKVIMGNPEKTMDVDHINHDTLDNRQSNLRVVTHAQNMANMKTHKDSKTGIKGIYVHKADAAKPYRSRIMFHGVIIDLGCFETSDEASEAYDSMARQLNGELAYQ